MLLVREIVLGASLLESAIDMSYDVGNKHKSLILPLPRLSNNTHATQGVMEPDHYFKIRFYSITRTSSLQVQRQCPAPRDLHSTHVLLLPALLFLRRRHRQRYPAYS